MSEKKSLPPTTYKGEVRSPTSASAGQIATLLEMLSEEPEFGFLAKRILKQIPPESVSSAEAIKHLHRELKDFVSEDEDVPPYLREQVIGSNMYALLSSLTQPRYLPMENIRKLHDDAWRDFGLSAIDKYGLKSKEAKRQSEEVRKLKSELSSLWETKTELRMEVIELQTERDALQKERDALLKERDESQEGMAQIQEEISTLCLE